MSYFTLSYPIVLDKQLTTSVAISCSVGFVDSMLLLSMVSSKALVTSAVILCSEYLWVLLQIVCYIIYGFV